MRDIFIISTDTISIVCDLFSGFDEVDECYVRLMTEFNPVLLSGGRVDQLDDSGSSSDNVGTTRQKISAHNRLQHGTLT
jgi:hypothetical protein